MAMEAEEVKLKNVLHLVDQHRLTNKGRDEMEQNALLELGQFMYAFIFISDNFRIAGAIIENIKDQCDEDLMIYLLRVLCSIKLIDFWKPSEMYPLAYCKQLSQYVTMKGLRYMYIDKCSVGRVIGEQSLIEDKPR